MDFQIGALIIPDNMPPHQKVLGVWSEDIARRLVPSALLLYVDEKGTRRGRYGTSDVFQSFVNDKKIGWELDDGLRWSEIKLLQDVPPDLYNPSAINSLPVAECTCDIFTLMNQGCPSTKGKPCANLKD